MSHSDTRLLARAIRERWPIPDEARPKAVAALLAVLEDGSALHRDRVMAVKALATLEAQNMAQQGVGAKGPDLHIHGDVSQLVLQAGRLLADGSAPSDPPEAGRSPAPPVIPVDVSQ